MNMKKSSLRILAALVLVSLVSVSLVACSNDGGSGDGGSSSSGYLDSIPNNVKFEGQTFTVLARQDGINSNSEHEISADENETETVNQAVYERNSKIENRFGCTIEPYFIPGGWQDSENFVNTFKNSIMSNSQAFDLIMSQEAYMAELGLNEYYLNFYDPELKYLNLGADYYYADVMEEMTINNQLYYLVGDYNLTYLESFYVLYFNKQIAEDLGLDNLYETVKDGSWTIDKMIEYSRKAYDDGDGDGYKSDADTCGLVSNYENTSDALFSQFDVQLTSKNESGIPEFTIDQGKVVSILRKMIDYYAEDCAYTYVGTSGAVMGEMPIDEIFMDGRALFYPERLMYAEMFRNMDTDFGIIPFPKWDENQAGYYTQSQNGYSVSVIPRDIKNKEFTGAMVEALNAESSAADGVTDAYYDIALKDKYSRDDESGEMIDLAREGAKINFGYFHAVPLGSAAQIFRTLLAKKMDTFVSYWAENQNGYNRSLGKILKSYGVSK